MTERLFAWWDGLSAVDRARWHALGLSSVLFLVMYAMLSSWYVEDAAISFSFARLATLGEGFVAYPGGERVEGFSNPSWTLVLAALDLVGINPWVAAKLLGAACGLACLPLAMAWSERILPEDSGLAPALAPFLLATSPQFVLWCAAGLENPLFNVLLAWGAVRAMREVDERLPPWSAVPLALLALTRPEAPLYTATIGALVFVFAVRRNGFAAATRWALGWAALLAAPILVWHGWRWNYFAWEFPNTYYAKLDEVRRFQPFGWGIRGWLYLRNYALESAHGFLLPFYVLGQTGLAGGRATVGLVVVGLGVLLVVPGLEWPEVLPFWPKFKEPSWLVQGRIVFLVAAAALLPLIGLGRRGSEARLLATALAGVALFFTLYSGGDWMQGYRWLGMATVPQHILLADAVFLTSAAIAERVGWGRLAWVGGAMLVATSAVVGVVQHVRYTFGPETSPYDVHHRVVYMRAVQERLALDHVTVMDVDMGAHMWWAESDIVDMAGLVDVPMGHHKWEKPFIKQYVYEQRNPEFAHVHGSWARRTKLTAHPEWRRYIEIEPYHTSPWISHPGAHVRKDLFILDRWPRQPQRSATFAEGVRVVALDLVTPKVGRGEAVYVEVGFQRGPKPRDFRPMLFIAGQGRVRAWDLPPGYDWYRPVSWKRNEVVVGRHSLSLPEDLPPGRYDVGIAVFDTSRDRRVMPRTDGGDPTDGVRFAAGEVVWRELLEILPLAEATKLADTGVDSAIAEAERGACEAAEGAWAVARRHLDPDDAWQDDARARLKDPMARCWAGRADPGEPAAVDAIVRARRWNHRDDEVIAAGRALADALEAEGAAAEARGDDAGAVRVWSDALLADPTRSWLRRRTEAARDRALGIRGDELPEEVAGGGG